MPWETMFPRMLSFDYWRTRESEQKLTQYLHVNRWNPGTGEARLGASQNEGFVSPGFGLGGDVAAPFANVCPLWDVVGWRNCV